MERIAELEEQLKKEKNKEKIYLILHLFKNIIIFIKNIKIWGS